MDVTVTLTVPSYVYHFYRNSSLHISSSSPEAVMSDALSAYAGLLSEDIARQRVQDGPERPGEDPSPSRSR